MAAEESEIRYKGQTSYNADRTMKLCRGPLHDEPMMIPVEDFTPVWSARRRQMILNSRCRACMAYKDRQRRGDAGSTGGAGEAEVVNGQQLAAVMQAWRVKYEIERPQEQATRSFDFMGPMEWLSQQTGLHTRRLHGLMKGEFKMVGLSQVDAILIAINAEHLIHTDEITVVANPRWSPENWQRYMRDRGVC